MIELHKFVCKKESKYEFLKSGKQRLGFVKLKMAIQWTILGKFQKV